MTKNNTCCYNKNEKLKTFFSALPDICQSIIEKTVNNEGQIFLGWRDVPVTLDFLGPIAFKSLPKIRQFFVSKNQELEVDFEQKLFIIRRQIELNIGKINSKDYSDFYICSLSAKKIVYKGLFQPNQLVNFYHDLSDYSIKTAFAIIHSRFSTNTLGVWGLAHPYRYIAHNGEINTIRGNLNWMYSRSQSIQSSILSDDINNKQNETRTDQPFVRNKPKIGRNEPCPCGSGKKYKQCHGKLS